MKRLFIISLLSLSVGLSQQIIHTETYENGNVKSITYHKKTRDGIQKVKEEGYFEKGEKKYEGSYKDGEMISKTEWEYYENRQKKYEWNYKNGKQDGLFTGWYENGQKNYEENYKDGEKFLSNFWDENGKIMIKNGNGVYTDFWGESGQKSDEIPFKNGKRNGVHTQWFDNGQKRYEITYKNGERISQIWYNEDGSVKE